MAGWRTMTYQIISEDGGSCGIYPTYRAALQYALHAAQTLHRTYSIIDLDDGEETITVGDHAH